VRAVSLVRTALWGIVYAAIVVAVVIVGGGGPAFIYQGF
jgi:hypothetical protein